MEKLCHDLDISDLLLCQGSASSFFPVLKVSTPGGAILTLPKGTIDVSSSAGIKICQNHSLWVVVPSFRITKLKLPSHLLWHSSSRGGDGWHDDVDVKPKRRMGGGESGQRNLNSRDKHRSFYRQNLNAHSCEFFDGFWSPSSLNHPLTSRAPFITSTTYSYLYSFISLQ